LLESAGFQVSLCSSASGAIERVSRGSLDAIVSDIRMPDVDGLQLLRAVREHGLDLPVILITG
jgi:DNA-binding NtrC family response regulator